MSAPLFQNHGFYITVGELPEMFTNSAFYKLKPKWNGLKVSNAKNNENEFLLKKVDFSTKTSMDNESNHSLMSVLMALRNRPIHFLRYDKLQYVL